MITDKQILEAYDAGWKGDASAQPYTDIVLDIAFNTGKTDFLLVDDVPSWYSRSEEEILKGIKDQAQFCVMYNGRAKDVKLYPVEVVEGALILSPYDTKERSIELFNEWMKENN